MSYKVEYDIWLNDNTFDEETKRELRSIADNEEEKKDRFYKNLEFGTAGLRGIMGVGTNRMNKYTVTKATQGLANFIKIKKGEDKGVAIAYDSRHNSREFAEETALCLNANGIKTYLFDDIRSTPELSFAVRELGCISGVIITASHNPPQYNGYKVYWEDGAQITYPKDYQISEQVEKILDYSKIKMISKDEAVKKGLYNIIGEEIDDKYVEAIKKNLLNMDAIIKQRDNIRIVYTPLHGTGALIVKRVLGDLGFKNLFIVPEQEKPDGDFPTVKYPNPEEKESFNLALELAKEKNADIVLASDPDADRLGVYVKNEKSNKYERLTGNMVGVLFTEYLLSQKKRLNILPENGVVIKTIVSTEMVKEIAKAYRCKGC